MLSRSIRSRRTSGTGARGTTDTVPLGSFLCGFVVVRRLLLLFTYPPCIDDRIIQSARVTICYLLRIFDVAYVFFEEVERATYAFLTVGGSAARIAFANYERRFKVTYATVIDPDFIAWQPVHGPLLNGSAFLFFFLKYPFVPLSDGN